MSDRPGRNDRCPCGSGLKYKHCHGDPEKAQACIHITQLYLMKLITEARCRSRIISRDECEDIVCRLRNDFLNMLYGYDDEPESKPEPETPKDVTSLQTELPRCPTCHSVTFGKECIKCKNRRNDEQNAGQSGGDKGSADC